ncbi:MAG: pre-peptidase C-terminal domain-containing protein, partial [Acidobacteriota bacterium]|nr:pre-peptidase C-terminal domain-containing protein [Acidobacteriota bacterium]
RPSRKKLRVGITRPFTQTQNPLAESTGYPLAEGRVNLFRVASEGAVQIRLQFTQFNLPAGARLFVYAANSPDEFYGPYQNNGPDGNGSFWTPPIRGEEIVVEYFAPESAPSINGTSSPFRVASVSHIFTDPQNRAALQANADCQLAIPAEWSEAAKSTGLLQFTLPDGEYLCTGTLLNNTANGNDPYLLTANHCFSTRPGASSLKVYWHYDSANQDPTSRPANYGSRLLATGEANDFTLVRLNQMVPAGMRYAGWTTEKPATAVPVAAIHHPEGEHKRIAFGKTIEKNCNTSFGIPCDNLLKVQWDSGVTAPGSSGSGLFVNSAADAKLVGTLIGGASACDNRTGADYYTRFEQIFPAISYFLAGSGCHYTLSQQRQFAAAAGSAGSIDVFPLAGAKCAWTASSTVSWIKVTTNSGSGEGTVKYTVDPNTASGRRAGLLTIAGHTLLINQLGTNEACEATPITLGETINGTLSPGACRSVLDDSALAVRYTFQANAGQQMAVNLDSAAFDAYLVLSGPDGEKIAEDDDSGPGTNARIPAPSSYSTNFITLLADGTYTIEVTSPDENPAGSFSLKLEKSCSYTVTPNKFLAGASGRDLNGAFVLNPAVEVEIKGDSACQFFIENDDAWLHIINNGSLTTGKGRITFSVDGNYSPTTRAALFQVAGVPIYLKQAAFCGEANRPTISPAGQNFTAAGGKGTVNVTMAQGEWCSWQAGYQPPYWVSVISPPNYAQSGTGNGQVEFDVGWLVGLKPRTGTLNIADQNFTINQEESIRNCPPLSLEFGQPISGILGGGDCHWRPDADSIADLYTFDGAAGQQIAINLTSPAYPVYFILYGPAKDPIVDSSSFFNQTEIRFPREGYYDLPATGNYILLVSSGTGNQAGNYSVKVETVGGPNCVYNLAAPDEQTIPAEGGMGIVKLFATDGCSWNITSTADWVTFPQGFSGKGGRNISFTVAANTGAERRATLTVGGRYFRILQQAPCSYVKIRPEDGRVYGSYKGSTVTISVETGQGCQFPAVSKTDWIKLYSLQPSQVLFNLEANNGLFRKGTVEVAGQSIEVQQGGTGVTVVSSADYSA